MALRDRLAATAAELSTIHGQEATMQRVTKKDIDGMLGTPLGGSGWQRYRKTALTKALRMAGPFIVETREGELTCPDGYLAIDAHGWPYPIAADEFERIYEPA